MRKLCSGLLLLAFGLFLSACTGTGGSANPSTDLRVEMNEFTFRPNYLSVPAGEKITLELKNDGSVAHDFTLLKKTTVLNGFFDPDKQAGEILFHVALDAGQAGTYAFMAPSEPGDYQIICEVPGHYQSGMTAILTVVVP